jgi:hypothetical protein
VNPSRYAGVTRVAKNTVELSINWILRDARRRMAADGSRRAKFSGVVLIFTDCEAKGSPHRQPFFISYCGCFLKAFAMP